MTVRRVPRLLLAIGAIVLGLGPAGCFRDLSKPEMAFGTYPRSNAPAQSVDIQAFREGEQMVVVNSTTTSYRDITMWLNQRYGRKIPTLLAGDTIRLSLWDFIDERGDVFVAGGFFSTEEPTPLLLVEIQEADDAPVIGLIAVGEPE